MEDVKKEKRKRLDEYYVFVGEINFHHILRFFFFFFW